jgi:Tfp pilus assembly protein PilN
MAAAQKKDGINLLPREEFAGTILGRILAWAVSAFRIIVISVEMVVVLAFLSRFWLDAQATDLDEEIKKKQAIITSQAAFESDFRAVQEKLKTISSFTSQREPLSLIALVVSHLPADVTVSTISSDANEIQVRANASSEFSIAQLITNLENEEQIEKVTLSQIGTKADSPFINFSLDIDL